MTGYVRRRDTTGGAFMVESRSTDVEDSEADVSDVNKVGIERSDDDREVDIQTGGLAVDVEKEPEDAA